MKKIKMHLFVVHVEGAVSKKAAEAKLLYAFARRDPDGAKFHLKPIKNHKAVWMDGAKAGTEIAFDLVEKALQNLRKAATGKEK